MRHAWVYATDRGTAAEVGRPLAALGFSARHVAMSGSLTPTGTEGRPSRPPHLAVVVAAKGEPPPAKLCARLQEEHGFGRVPLVLVVEPEHLSVRGGLPSADELLVRPYRAAELGVRVARAAREGRGSEGDATLRADTLELDERTYSVSDAGRPIVLTRLEFELLRFLMRNPRRVFTREVLLNRVWGYEYYGGARTVDVHVRRLRAKLGHEHAERIGTVRGVGYRFG
jgi:DNA-binding response OmpR family regulator